MIKIVLLESTLVNKARMGSIGGLATRKFLNLHLMSHSFAFV